MIPLLKSRMNFMTCLKIPADNGFGVKIIVGDRSGKMRKEEAFRLTIDRCLEPA